MKSIAFLAATALLSSRTAALHDICKGCNPEGTSCNYQATLTSGWLCRDEFLGLDEQVRLISATGAKAGDGVDTVIQMRDPSSGSPPKVCGRGVDEHTIADADDNGGSYPDGIYKYSTLPTLRQLNKPAQRIRICVKSYWAYCTGKTCANSGDYCGYYRAQCSSSATPAPFQSLSVQGGTEVVGAPAGYMIKLLVPQGDAAAELTAGQLKMDPA